MRCRDCLTVIGLTGRIQQSALRCGKMDHLVGNHRECFCIGELHHIKKSASSSPGFWKYSSCNRYAAGRRNNMPSRAGATAAPLAGRTWRTCVCTFRKSIYWLPVFRSFFMIRSLVLPRLYVFIASGICVSYRMPMRKKYLVAGVTKRI